MSNRRSNGGEFHGSAKLTVTDVIAIRKLAADGMTHRALGARYSVSVTPTSGTSSGGKEWRQLLEKSASGHQVAREQDERGL